MELSKTRLAEAHSLVDSVHKQVSEIVVGQRDAIDRVLIALLTGGHLLLEGVPGVAKTLLVHCVAHTVDLSFGRVQLTIDLLPSDIVGSEILDQKTGSFKVSRGPIFTNLLLADEINRAAPKVQSALLEAMQERRVTIGKEALALPTPFLVIATQNPVEQSGTFDLPEAQLDRFMLRHRMGYPTLEEETEVLQRSLTLGTRSEGKGVVPKTAFDLLTDGATVDHQLLREAVLIVQDIYVSDAFTQHVLELVRRTREHELVELGCSPRAGISLIHSARALAFIRGRDHVIPDDLFALAEDVLTHRIRLTYDALAQGRHTDDIVQEILSRLD